MNGEVRGVLKEYGEQSKVFKRQRGATDISIIMATSQVRYICPFCDKEQRVDYEKFKEEQGAPFWDDWNEFECANCGAWVKIEAIRPER